MLIPFYGLEIKFFFEGSKGDLLRQLRNESHLRNLVFGKYSQIRCTADD